MMQKRMTLAARLVAVAMILGCFVTSCGTSVRSTSAFADLPVFTSRNHLLDLLVVAKATTISLGTAKPAAWVFEMCQTADAHNDQCPADSQTVAPYGGIRLQLYPGDHLRMRLVNHLPPAPDDAENAHGDDAMMNEMLAANPVNIHTHGLIVEPRKADTSDPTYGDYVYVLGYPAGKLPAMLHPDETATDQPIQYNIYIPATHPSGLFWFHPHVHGLGVNQLSEGLSGVITIGSVSDYLGTAGAPAFNLPQRYIIIKDMQVLANGEAQDQEDADFCAGTSTSGDARAGYCEGQDNSKDPEEPGLNYTGGRWYFTINGKVFPELPVHDGGEVWRLLNAGASRSYDLVLEDDRTKAPLQFQVLSLDGVALSPPSGANADQVRAATANKVDAVPCSSLQDPAAAAQPVCATHLIMMPSSRAEIWVAPGQSTAGVATLRTKMINTGSDGDDWPEAQLAHVTFSGSSGKRVAALSVRPVEKRLLSSTGLLGAPVEATFAGIDHALALNAATAAETPDALTAELSPQQFKAIQAHMRELSRPVVSIASPACSALPPGHRRRIFFGVPAGQPDGFGLGYEEVDGNGEPVPGTFHDVASFDPTQVDVCLPLAAGNMPVTEQWELVNVAGEMHNFHMHQTKFYVFAENAPDGDGGVLMDNVPLPTGGATCDGSVDSWRSGDCKVPTVRVAIPFAEVGDFVYHCHIGEHQDGGMMAHIRVIAHP